MKHKVVIIGGRDSLIPASRYFAKNFQVNILDVKSSPQSKVDAIQDIIRLLKL